jgi:hypothetical protein
MTGIPASTSPTDPPSPDSHDDPPVRGEHEPAHPPSLHDQQRELVRASLIARPQ